MTKSEQNWTKSRSNEKHGKARQSQSPVTIKKAEKEKKIQTCLLIALHEDTISYFSSVQKLKIPDLRGCLVYGRNGVNLVKEMAKEVQSRRSGEPQDLYDVLDKIQVRTVANDEILGFAKLFNDQLTLRNISRPRATLFSMPVDTVGVTSLPFEDSVSERQRKLEKEEEAMKHHSVESNKDVALEEIINATAAYAQQQLCKLSEA
nr:mitochondrial proton/calcium exchanger protein-like [Tanacetum cinerariifolium]